MATQSEQLEIYKKFYDSFKKRPINVGPGEKIDYIKARALDVEESLSRLAPDNEQEIYKKLYEELIKVPTSGNTLRLYTEACYHIEMAKQEMEEVKTRDEHGFVDAFNIQIKTTGIDESRAVIDEIEKKFSDIEELQKKLQNIKCVSETILNKCNPANLRK